MLGPAELREINEALAQAGADPAPDGRGPYLSAAFAAAMALARALREATAGSAAGREPPPPAP
ncbi:hypothetical protein [Phaeospirillum tilakii]|uniref:Uncharacterized protein n=1 Tax=Phaeospirillum tilakii TaxID=741673 RepID=A0ABW5CEU8_9PROT